MHSYTAARPNRAPAAIAQPTYCPPRPPRPHELEPTFLGLNTTQMQVLALMSMGISNEEIAQLLGTSQQQVSGAYQTALRCVNANSMREVVGRLRISYHLELPVPPPPLYEMMRVHPRRLHLLRLCARMVRERFFADATDLARIALSERRADRSVLVSAHLYRALTRCADAMQCGRYRVATSAALEALGLEWFKGHL